MNFKGLISAFILTVFCIAFSRAQLSNSRQKYIYTNSDTIQLDTLSIIPGSLFFFYPDGKSFTDTSIIKKDEPSSKLFITSEKDSLPDSLLVVYRVFPIMFSKTYRNRDRSVIEKNYGGLYNPFTYGESGTNVFKLEGLQRSGNISRGISFGNNQDLVVNSSFNLQLAGKLSDDVEILAAITDNNIPVQPEGNTQQIQDFDKVFIQLSKNKSKLLVGDFELRRPESYFMNFFKKGQGGVFSTAYKPGKSDFQQMRTTVSGAVSKGKYARNVFNGQEANQGPYRLTGSENESFIIVLSGTEKVFIDGVQVTRGEQYDYIIDYNTAEITFTTRRPITKDKRIVVEFQYSDKNYSRTMFFVNQEYEDKRLKLKANLFSEQDGKNQPLLQDLDTQQKQLLADVGDSIQQAFFPNIDSVPFNSTEVLYTKRDSAGFIFYEYSTDSLISYYRLGFSFVGSGKGNYLPIAASANGRVFRWIAPVNGVLQGSYEPVILLIAPKKQQMFTLGGDYKISDKTKIFFETALSQYNSNLFSKKDKADDQGYAVIGGIEKGFRLSKDSLGWNLLSTIRLEHVNNRFRPIEVFRPSEFSRDWNLGTAPVSGDENAANISLVFSKPKQLLGYQLRSFFKGNDYKGLMNILTTRIEILKFRLISDVSLLNSESPLVNSIFLRSATDLSRPVGNFIFGSRYEQERNSFTNVISDSLQTNSFSFDMGKLYIANSDTSKIKFRVDVTRRFDYGVTKNNFKKTSEADEASGRIEFSGNPKSRLTLSSSYRNLRITDTILTFQKPEETILNRVEYNAVILKGFITSMTFYEAGTGQELKREYAFLEVAAGTGVYTYAADYNGNGVKDLDEFEIAAFADQANFVKIYLPTNEYVKTRTNQFNQVITINPAAYFQKQEGIQKLAARFSNQTSFRVDNKTLEKDIIKALNPFRDQVDDAILLATNSSLRNTLSFNRNSTVFGVDATWQDNRNKSILTNGFETRQLSSLIFNLRWNLSKVYSTNLNTENGNKLANSQFFSTRDYNLSFYKVETKFNVQPGISFRSTFIYEYSVKENLLGEINEKADQHTAGVELKYSSVKRGIATAKFSMIEIAYNASENTSIAYEILEGLREGRNFTWGFTLQRNLSNSIQLNLNYEGRKPTGTKIVHTGGLQARAFF